METFITEFLKGLGKFTSFALVFHTYTSYLKYIHKKTLENSEDGGEYGDTCCKIPLHESLGCERNQDCNEKDDMEYSKLFDM
jgi:hypothetical protein